MKLRVMLQMNRHTKNKIRYLVGDFNQDLIKYHTDTNYQNFIDNAASHGLVQLVSRPTRITDKSATLIDHVYTNNLDNRLSCNVLTLDLSDRLATHTRLLLKKTKTKHSTNFRNKRNDIYHDIRIFNEANNETFKNSVKN